ncbi:hypothetical protein G7Y89_g9951 [Cudoniella acicularis]|uniref:Glutaredoxin n=1 Tax=Cudoniella acicularis TaxID=354080 RepID=A0A8H4RDP5_9HELO|nr:hypothetical protein G7Y89_g9951 [Cudoniella acicularis]
MSTLLEITSEEDWNKHVDSTPPTALQIISFYAPWAAPCKQMRTVLETLASSYPVTDPLSTSWVTMNAESVMDTSDFFNVTAVPYLVLTRNKQVIETVSGSDASKFSAEEAKETKEALEKRLAALVKAAPVMLFMKGTPSAPQCGFSRQLVALLRENSVKYGFFNILADDDVRQGLKVWADWPTFPQLWVDGELIGGLDIVKEEISNDPDFLKAYSVAKSTPTAPSQQATAAT